MKISQLLKTCTLKHVFVIFCALCQQLKLVMDSIIWAFRHTERNVAETGLNLLLEILTNFQVRSSTPCMFLCSYITYHDIFLDDIFNTYSYS